MKKWIFSSISAISLLSTFSAQADTHTFMPANDLWKQDRFEATSNLTKQTFETIVRLGKEAYEPFAKEKQEQLVINPLWDDSEVNANCLRDGGVVEINMYGGLARRSEINQEGFAMVLCHELGHAYGGAPYIVEENEMAAEGQADFYSANVCVQKILANLPTVTSASTSPYATEKCASTFAGDDVKIAMCNRAMVGGLGLGKLLSVLTGGATPTFETPDKRQVSTTNVDYPDTVQCRLDTYHNGILNLIRPRCWFKN